MSLVERASGQITAAREADTARPDLADRAREESPSASLPAIRAPVLHKGRAPLAVQCCRGAQLLILMDNFSPAALTARDKVLSLEVDTAVAAAAVIGALLISAFSAPMTR